jgi:hypothetical protein
MKSPIKSDNEPNIQNLESKERGIGRFGLIILAVAAAVVIIAFFAVGFHIPRL